MKKLFCLIFCIVTISVNSSSMFDQLLTIQVACDEHAATYQSSLISQEQFLATIQAFTAAHQEHLPSAHLFVSYAHKKLVPHNSEIAFWGDIHGSFHSLMRCLVYLYERGYINANLRIIKDNFYMVFLGDFVDRGLYAVETMYTLYLLKLNNMDRVCIMRGNHEEASLNMNYGFYDELMTKYPCLTTTEIQSIFNTYIFLPAVLYIGSMHNGVAWYLQCCHGGLELGFNPKKFLSSDAATEPLWHLARADELNNMPQPLQSTIKNVIPSLCLQNTAATASTDLGFLWNDFCCHEKQHGSYMHGRGWVFSKEWTKAILELHSSSDARVIGIFRAHQHHSTMLRELIKQKGVVRLFDNLVTTFLSARINGFAFDSFGILTCSEDPSTWTLNHIVLNN